MPQKTSELRLFFREFRRNFHHTGAVAPSSRFLAAALSRYVAPGDEGRRILEVGPGTGAVTRRIVSVMGEKDELDLVELNESFVRALEHRFQSEAEFQAVAARARVLHQRLEELPQGLDYDVIVSGLPLNNFSAEGVQAVLETMQALARPGATLSFFEYIAVRPMRAVVSNGAGRKRLREIGRLLSEFLKDKAFRRDMVLINMPPAWVHHVTLRRPGP